MPEQKNEVFMVRTPKPVTELPDEQEIEQLIAERQIEEVGESPTKEANGDDLAGLFQAPSRDDPDMRVDDLVSVSDEDIYGEGGEDMSDLTEVSAEDVMGEDLGEPTPPPQPQRRLFRRTKKPYRRQEPPSLSIQGIRRRE